MHMKQNPATELRKKVGIALKEARKSQGITQEALADMVGRSMNGNFAHRTLQDYEAGKIPLFPTITLRIIDDILGTEFYAQLYGNATQYATKPAPQATEASSETLTQSMHDLAYSCRKNADTMSDMVAMARQLTATISSMQENEQHKNRSIELLLQRVLSLGEHAGTKGKAIDAGGGDDLSGALSEQAAAVLREQERMLAQHRAAKASKFPDSGS